MSDAPEELTPEALRYVARLIRDHRQYTIDSGIETAKAVNNEVEGGTLFALRELDRIIREEFSDCEILMQYADRELADTIYVKGQLRDQELQRAGLPVPLPGE